MTEAGALSLRPPTLGDLGAVAGLLAQRNLADLGHADGTVGDLREAWTRADLDLARDAVIAEADGEIVGYALARRAPSMAAVAVGHEGQGIGGRLLIWVEERERALGFDRHRQAAGGLNARARELLQASGYGLDRRYLRMMRELDGVGEPGEPPAGMRLRAVDPRTDADALHRLDDVAFSRIPDYRPHTLEEFRSGHLEGQALDPEASRVAEHGGIVVGFLLARRMTAGRIGCVDVLAVDPAWQGRGLGTALLRRAWSRFRSAGLARTELIVASDNPLALSLYARLGMRERFVFLAFSKPIEA